jgi:glycosyltransferase involved in cell wall biosynthesis
LVLFVGRLVAAKGLRELLAAAASLARERPLLKVAILGDGPLRHELERQAQRSGAGENVLMRGPRPPADVARWLAAADLLCLPSYSEGCPNVVLEALSCGRPVVASAVGGVPELVAEDCAVLVPPADSQALTAGLRIALTRPWDEKLIASRHTRPWEDVGHEVYQLCLRVARAGNRTQPPVPPPGR